MNIVYGVRYKLTYIALHKQYSLKRLRDFTPYWQNTFAMITGDVSYISPEILDVEKVNIVYGVRYKLICRLMFQICN